MGVERVLGRRHHVGVEVFNEELIDSDQLVGAGLFLHIQSGQQLQLSVAGSTSVCLQLGRFHEQGAVRAGREKVGHINCDGDEYYRDEAHHPARDVVCVGARSP